LTLPVLIIEDYVQLDRFLLSLYCTAIGTQHTNARATVLCNGHYAVGVSFYMIVLSERIKD